MSSSPTALTSTTSSSTSSPSPSSADPAGSLVGSARASTPTALIACGAARQPAARIVEQQGWDVDVHPLPPLLHNQPQKIAGEVERLAQTLRSSYDTVAVGYADCGTYGSLDEVCDRLGLARLAGLHCYD